ncbi:4-hydroxy-tetrahydrodipicolinate synthase [Novosphingobium sp.]|uniref:4-hydroxy-tetrahydrodipicolinate synthase n=1 Tax=Novosphingobium sp. TaxID=1874826 RepID=UPI003BAA2DA2
MLINGPEWLCGSFTPLVTPFREGHVDYCAFEQLVDQQVEGGSHGVVITGTTGEPTSLTTHERLELFRRAVAVVARRCPVVAATGTLRQDETIALTAAAAEAGVTAVMVVAPGFIKPSAEGLGRYFEAVLGAVEIPALLYNIPGRAGVTITAEVVARVASACPNLVGIKTASPDLEYVTDLLVAHGPQFRIFCGLESYTWPMMAIGAAGVMSAVGNLMPRVVADMCEAVFAGDMAMARSIHLKLHRLNQSIFFDTNPGPLKTMMAMMRLSSAELRPPLAEPSAAVVARLDAVLRDFGALPSLSCAGQASS